MRSKWYESKDDAVNLRKKGVSIGDIERRLRIPRSTLSGWFKDIELTKAQREKLLQSRNDALVKARKKAVEWHHAQKEGRMAEARLQALETLQNIDIKQKEIVELALAMLYMGEGTKRKIEASMGSSDPLILKFFLTAIKVLYGKDPKKIKCQLNLRADQNPEKMRIFWSEELGIPVENFGYIYSDRRTAGTKTYPNYKGVCQIIGGGAAIQRKLIYISEIFCRNTVEK